MRHTAHDCNKLGEKSRIEPGGTSQEVLFNIRTNESVRGEYITQFGKVLPS